MKKLSRVVLILMLVVMGSTAWGDIIVPPPVGEVIDPSTFFIGNPPSPALNGGGTYLFGGEVVPITPNFLQMVINGNGDLLNSPLYLILGIPNSSSFILPTATLNFGSVTGSGYTGVNLTSGEEVYTEFGISGGNNSNSFTNWHDAELAINDIDATFFGLYAFEFAGTGLDGGRTLDVTFAGGGLPVGTFAIGYATAPGHGNSGTQVYSTPFTEAGNVNTVPEPGTMMLLGSGLVGLAGWGRKRFRK